MKTANDEYLRRSGQGSSSQETEQGITKASKADSKESAFSMPEKGKQYSLEARVNIYR